MNRIQAPAQRFFGVQWRLILTHVTVGVATAAAATLLMLVPFFGERGPGGVILGGVIILAASAVGGAWLGLRSARDVKRRLREAGRFAAALAWGDYRHRISFPHAGAREHYDEIDQLAEELNAMADNLEAAIGELRDLAERNRALAEEAGRLASLEERTKLARDLHDTVNQQVFSLSMQAASARRRLDALRAHGGPAADSEAALAEVSALLGEVEELARSAHRQMRDLILQLRPTTLEQQGVGPALEEYVKAFAEREGLQCRCRVEAGGRFGRAVEEAVFRIAQEALNNVAKHAGAKEVEVLLALDGPAQSARDGDTETAGWCLILTVRDDGRGFDPEGPVRPTAMGLRGLRERAAALGGRVKVESSPGRGTLVEVRLPVSGT